MDRYHPATVFSSIDHGGRYAYGNQPVIAQWNLARLAETLLPFFADSQQEAVAVATAVLESFTARYEAQWRTGMQGKLGLAVPLERTLADDLLALMQAQAVDFTGCFRALSSAVRGDLSSARALFDEPAAFDAWAERWTAARAGDTRPADEVAEGMDRVNPVYIPRNHLVEQALDAATAGDLRPVHALLDVLGHPYDERPGLHEYAAAGPVDGDYRTFCGT
jgi:uncharacterized protein YdiU (UPF0061 family)